MIIRAVDTYWLLLVHKGGVATSHFFSSTYGYVVPVPPLSPPPHRPVRRWQNRLVCGRSALLFCSWSLALTGAARIAKWLRFASTSISRCSTGLCSVNKSKSRTGASQATLSTNTFRSSQGACSVNTSRVNSGLFCSEKSRCSSGPCGM